MPVLGANDAQQRLSTQRKQKNSKNPKRRKTQKPKKQRQRRRGKNSSGSPTARLPISPCSLLYARALADPFAMFNNSKEICIPDLYDLPSKKFKTLSRFTFTIGTNGVGGVILAPFTFANDTQMAYATSATTTSINLPLPADTGAQPILDQQFPYPTAARRNVRLVAAGLRVRYTGTELNRSGQVIPITCSADQDNVSGESQANLLARQDVKVYANDCDRDWVGCAWRPASQAQMQYLPNDQNATVPANTKMAVMVVGKAGESYFCEIVRYFEAQPSGVLTVDGVTTSESDVVGLSAVRNFFGSISSSSVGQGVWNAALAYFKTNYGIPLSSLEWTRTEPTIVEL